MSERGTTVLVVEDEPTRRYILGNWLRLSGHRVIEASDGEQALETVRADRPDLVILDVRLPGIDGYEVCERIKADPATSSIPVIQISGKAVSLAERVEGLERGADAYMIEPVEPIEFMATVTATLRYHHSFQRAERMAWRLAQLTEITLQIKRAESFDQLVVLAVEGAARMLGRYVGALILPPDGRVRRYTAYPGERAEAKHGSQEMLDALNEMPPKNSTNYSSYTLTMEKWGEIAPDTEAKTDIAVAVVRTKPGTPPVYMGVEANPPLDPDEHTLLRQLSQALALAVDSLRVYTEEHAIALTLQRHLLPIHIPDTPGMRISVRYQPAAHNVEIGGDFYEVLPIGDRVLVAIGDVQGHSLYAATVMAELRHTLRASVIDAMDLAGSLRLLNAVLMRYHPGMTASVCLMLIDPVTGAVELANAGHIPPLLAGSGARYLGCGDLLLGVAEEDYHVERLHLAEGDTLLLFTDGLVEEEGTLLDEGLDMVRHMAEHIGDNIDVFCDRLITKARSHEDDIALIVLRRDSDVTAHRCRHPVLPRSPREYGATGGGPGGGGT